VSHDTTFITIAFVEDIYRGYSTHHIEFSKNLKHHSGYTHMDLSI